MFVNRSTNAGLYPCNLQNQVSLVVKKPIICGGRTYRRASTVPRKSCLPKLLNLSLSRLCCRGASAYLIAQSCAMRTKPLGSTNNMLATSASWGSEGLGFSRSMRTERRAVLMVWTGDQLFLSVSRQIAPYKYFVVSTIQHHLGLRLG